MSMMCSMNGSCTKHSGLCTHEKMMMLMMVIAMAVGGYFYFAA